ncbi:vitamin B12 ABC transporter permease BtuC [Halocatena marina]|uniref:Vitamin B12 ABC transporter permease BtuC n=1 Tax=Halocatena marina TaxID=2934937 RepID=A0ABD5YNE7_9EURY|nr:vitamin B12 ABC transporter permease BtuC [Halocatena marina]
MRRWMRTIWWSVGLLCLLVLTVIWSVTIGPVRISALVVAKAILNAVSVPAVTIDPVWMATTIGHAPWLALDISFVHPFDFPVPRSKQIIVNRLRLPRIVLAAVVGFALSTAGTVMQGFFRNPMADPSIIGVSSGAAVGAVATLVFSLSIPFGLQGIAFLSALVTAFSVYLIATKNGRTPVATLLLAGVAVQTFLGAVVSYMLLQAGRSINTVLHWLMGDLARASWNDVTISLSISLIAFVLLCVFTRDLNVLLLGEEDARTLGINVERTKRILLAVSSLITAAAVSVAGVIGFVGLIVPHMLRLLVGPDHRILLPTSAIAGAVFLVATDTIARSGTAQLPVGIVTAALGAPFFLYLLRRREVHRL